MDLVALALIAFAVGPRVVKIVASLRELQEES